MDFSDSTSCTGPTPVVSPDGRCVAFMQEYRLTVRDVETQELVQVFSCAESVESLAWSPTGEHILCVLSGRALVQVFSIADLLWSCTINEGAAGVLRALWSGTGRHVVVVPDFCIRLSVWNLSDDSVQSLPGPKFYDRGIDLHPDGTHLVVLGRASCKDSLAVYQCSDWRQTVHIPLSTHDATEASWSPSGDSIAVCDGPAHGYRFYVVAADGSPLASYLPPVAGLGVRHLSWSPSGQLLAVGTHEDGLDILDHVTWTPLVTLAHPLNVTEPRDLVAYVEEEEGAPGGLRSLKACAGSEEGLGGQAPDAARPLATCRSPSKLPPPGSPSRLASLSGGSDTLPSAAPVPRATRSRFALATLPLRLPAPPKGGAAGVAQALWSSSGSFVAARCEEAPAAIWIWSVATLRLQALLVLVRPVKTVSWEPGADRLAVCTGTGKLFLWTPEGASCAHVPFPGFRAQSAVWNPKGGSLVLAAKNAFCCAYVA